MIKYLMSQNLSIRDVAEAILQLESSDDELAATLLSFHIILPMSPYMKEILGLWELCTRPLIWRIVDFMNARYVIRLFLRIYIASHL